MTNSKMTIGKLSSIIKKQILIFSYYVLCLVEKNTYLGVFKNLMEAQTFIELKN